MDSTLNLQSIDLNDGQQGCNGGWVLGLRGFPLTGKVLIAEEQIGPNRPENWAGEVLWVCWRLLICYFIHSSVYISIPNKTAQHTVGFPGGTVVKNTPANAGEAGSIPGWGRSPGGGNGNLLWYSCLGNPMDRGHRNFAICQGSVWCPVACPHGALAPRCLEKLCQVRRPESEHIR